MNTLILPAGVKFPKRYEIPGTRKEKDATLKTVADAKLNPGYVVSTSEEGLFNYYSILNVHAPGVWELFAGLSYCLLEERATLYASEDEEELEPIVSESVTKLIRYLEPHKFQLANDGFLHFALVSQSESSFFQVYVAATKHLEVWFDKIDSFREKMNEYKIPECEVLQLLSEVPHVTKQLRSGNGPLHSAWELLKDLSKLRSEI